MIKRFSGKREGVSEKENDPGTHGETPTGPRARTAANIQTKSGKVKGQEAASGYGDDQLNGATTLTT